MNDIEKDAGKRAPYDEMQREFREESPDPAQEGSSALASAQQPAPGSASSSGSRATVRREKPLRLVPSWLLAGMAIAFCYWGYLFFENTPQSKGKTTRTTVQPTPRGLSEEFDGTTKGNPFGVSFVQALRGRGVAFDSKEESRIEYSFGNGFPRTGTLEWRILVNSGYQWTDGVLNEQKDDALIFTTTGPDTWYPGSAWVTVSRNGDVNFSMADSKGGQTPLKSLVAKNTGFSFGGWHTIGVSFGSQGRVINVDGRIVAKDTLVIAIAPGGTPGGERYCNPTIGEMKSVFWRNNQHDSGFSGIVDSFRASQSQLDWKICSSESPSPRPIEDAEAKRKANQAALIQNARSLLVGTWHEEDGKQISFFQDGTCAMIRKGEDEAGLNWTVSGDIITFEKPSGRKVAYRIDDISEERYRLTLVKDPNRVVTLADAFNRDGWKDKRTASKLDSAGTTAAKSRLREANLAKAHQLLPGVWKGPFNTWRVFPDGSVHVWKTYSAGYPEVESYRWRLSGDRLNLTSDLKRYNDGDPRVESFVLLGIWENLISCGELGSYGVTQGGYSDMERIASRDELQKQRDEELNAIAQAEAKLLGTWRDDDSTFTFKPDGSCVVAKDDAPRHEFRWSVNDSRLEVGTTRFTIWMISDEKLVLTQHDRSDARSDDDIIERYRVK